LIIRYNEYFQLTVSFDEIFIQKLLASFTAILTLIRIKFNQTLKTCWVLCIQNLKELISMIPCNHTHKFIWDRLKIIDLFANFQLEKLKLRNEIVVIFG
jgi:hypothetical protein